MLKKAILMLFAVLMAETALCEVGLRISGKDINLIRTESETQKMIVHVFSDKPLNGIVLEGIVRGFGGNRFKKNQKKQITVGERTATVEFTFERLSPGLYEFFVRAESPEKAVLAEKSTNLAVIVPTAPNERPAEMGICTHYGQAKWTHPEVVFKMIRNAGFTRIRDELYWSQVELEKEKYTFSKRYDDYIRLAEENGLSPLIIFSYGNKLYPTMTKKKKGFPLTPENRRAFIGYVQALVKRYGKTVHAWELWNEPNTIQPKTEYLPLLKEVYPAIKQIDPSAVVISCGGGGAGGGPGGGYISQIVRAGGIDFQDAFSIHPYMSPYEPDRGYPCGKGSPIRAVNISTVWKHLGRFIERNPRSDGKKLELWVTEIGWPSGSSQGTSELMQAAYLVRTYLLARRWQTAKAVFWYDFLCDGSQKAEGEHNFGIVNADFSPKPAYVAANVMSRFLKNEPFVKAHRDDMIKIYEYGMGDNRFWACWSGYRGKVEFPLPDGCTVIQTDWSGFSKTLTPQKGKIHLGVTPLPIFLKFERK